MKIAPLVLLLACACGPEPLDAAFTSRVVQHETCTVAGEADEACKGDETLTDLKVRLVERIDDNVWLYGVPKDGTSDRAILGSKDDEGGWLFVDEVTHSNSDSKCTVTDRTEISLALDPKADESAVGVDDCIALVGREVETTTSTEGCDGVNDPPLETTLIARKRWERSPTCKR